MLFSSKGRGAPSYLFHLNWIWESPTLTSAVPSSFTQKTSQPVLFALPVHKHVVHCTVHMHVLPACSYIAPFQTISSHLYYQRKYTSDLFAYIYCTVHTGYIYKLYTYKTEIYFFTKWDWNYIAVCDISSALPCGLEWVNFSELQNVKKIKWPFFYLFNCFAKILIFPPPT